MVSIMGQFIYNSTTSFELDDRVLAHLQVVIINRLRRRESFAFDLLDKSHLVTLWIDERTALEFRYSGNRPPSINTHWIEEMAEEAGIHGLLRITPEPPMPPMRVGGAPPGLDGTGHPTDGSAAP